MFRWTDTFFSLSVVRVLVGAQIADIRSARNLGRPATSTEGVAIESLQGGLLWRSGWIFQSIEILEIFFTVRI
jgi:hypothetical protein